MLQKPKTKAPMITIVAPPGVGKTTLGGLFPNPVFIQAEDAQTVFEGWDEDVQPDFMPRLPRAKKADDGKELTTSTHRSILDQLRWLIANEHDRKTLVVDSVTTLNTMLEHELCEVYNVDNVADASGGFHKGYIAVSEMHGAVRSACEILRDRKGMTIVFLAHIGVQKVKAAPDVDEYSVWTLEMPDKSVHNYVNQVDAVLYIKKDVFITGKETNKKTGLTTKYGKRMDTGDRTMVTTGDGKVGYLNCKSRYPMPAEIPLPLGENPILQYIPFFKKQEK